LNPGNDKRDEATGPDVTERQLGVIIHIARLATQDLALQPMLQRIVGALREGFGWEFVAYASVDVPANRFTCEALSAEMPSEMFIGYSRALGSGVCGEVAATGRTVRVDDVAGQGNYVETMTGVRSELCVPVKHAGNVLGLINLESVRPAAFMGQEALLEMVADQVAGIIAAARLHAEVGRRAAALALTSDIARTALEADGLAGTLARIAEFMRERFGLVNCAILLAGPAPDSLVLHATSGDSVFKELGAVWICDKGIVGRTWRTGQAQFIPDVTRDPDYVLTSAAVATELCVPVKFRDRLLGVIDLEAARADVFAGDGREVLALLADQVAGAIHLATVNERLRDTLKLVEEKSAALERANTELVHVNEKLERLSAQDGLTGIANRRQFDETLAQEWRRAQRNGHALALLLIDVDHFKAFNDGYGHLGGDDCLKRIAAALAAGLNRAGDLIARFGGEEFAALLPEMDAEAAMRAAEHLRRAVGDLALPHRFGGDTGCVTASVGVAAVVPHPGLEPVDLIGRADKALYAAKLGGRNAVRRFQESGG
jgi:diguanylate cyclase (GGDEF)-like protein